MDAILKLQEQYIAKMKTSAKQYAMNHKGKNVIIQPKVFPPYLDSFLLIESMAIKENDLVLDVCSGTGIVALFACDKAKRVIATDISPYAVKNINENIKLHALHHKMEAIETDLFPTEINTKFDVITINPPYTDHKANTIEEKSVWDENNQTIKNFFKALDSFIANNGRVYLSWADFADINLIENLCSKHSYNYKIIQRKKDNTSLFVVFEIRKCITIDK